MSENIYKRIILTLVTLLGLFLFLFIFRSLHDKNSNEGLLKKYLKDAEKQSQIVIDQKQKNIDRLLKKIDMLQCSIEQKQGQIDSLKKQKNKVEYIYIQNIKKINKYDSKELEEYWKNEFQ